MKLVRWLFVSLFVSASLMAQMPAGRSQAQITFHVITDSGKPVQGVTVTASTFQRWQPGESFGQDVYADFTGTTDVNGLTTISFSSQRGDCEYGIYNVPGYYSTRNLVFQFKSASNGQWQPWNPTVDVVLKPVVNPIAMYARKVGVPPGVLQIPSQGIPIGFDLMADDWVAPYGKGAVSDFIFTLNEAVPFTSYNQPFDVTLTLSFSNKGDGIQSVMASPDQGSDLQLQRYAPVDGYQSQLVKEMVRLVPGKKDNTTINEDQNYFYRVRTVFDDNGRVKSALYGKVTGDIGFDVINSKLNTALILFSYYLNPNANDVNMEFNPKQNLFGRLPFDQRVIKP